MFFCDKNKKDDVEKIIYNIIKENKLSNITILDLYKIISIYYPYSGLVIINDIEYLCVNDLYYNINGKVDNIYKYKDDKLNKNYIKYL